jgi:hypothetical protein
MASSHFIKFEVRLAGKVPETIFQEFPGSIFILVEVNAGAQESKGVRR